MSIDPNQAKSLFLAALELPAAERTAYLDEQCKGDEELRRRVASLLQEHEKSGELLPASAYASVEEATKAEATAAFGEQSEPPRTEAEGGIDGDLCPYLAPAQTPGRLGRLGHYEIIELLGKGGFGTVFRAFDTKLHRVVAIKVLAPELAASGTARKRFIREAQAAAAIKNDHVVAIYNVEDEHQPPYLVMEYIDGLTLQGRLDEEGPLELKEILRIGVQMAEGLAAAHKHGLVHRDIKPANILLENGVQRVKITDFGLAKVADDASVTQSGVIAGTPMYMSPEQAEGLPFDHRSDLFSLGTVLYVMCTGRPPFRATGTIAVLKRVVEETPRPIREINTEIPEWLCGVIAKLHEKKPEDRFESARQVADLLSEALANVQAGRAIGEPSRVSDRVAAPAAAPTIRPLTGLGSPHSDHRRPGKWAIVNAMLVLALLIAVGWWYAPTISRFTRGVGKVVLDANADEVQHLLLKKDGETVTLLPTEEGIELPPGNHDLEAVAADGSVIAKFEQLRRPHFNSQSAFMVYSVPRSRLTLARGEEVRIKITTTAAAPTQEKPAAAEPGWVQLFNGKDLAGWKHDSNEVGEWQVENGVLIGKGRLARLMSERGDYAHFHLRAEVQVNDKGVGGIWFRTPADRRDGYQAQINSTAANQKTGSLLVKQAKEYNWIHTVPTSPVPAETWFTLEVIANGSQITIKVNGTEFANVEDATYHQGHLSLTTWEHKERTGPTTVRFRKIEIKEIKGLPPPAPFDAEQATITEIRRFEGHSQPVWALAVSSDGKLLASGAADGTIRVWDVASRRLLHVFTGHRKGRQCCVAFSPDGKRIVTGDWEGHMRIWDLATDKLLTTLLAHEGGVYSVTFSPDGSKILSTGCDNTARLWAATGMDLITFKGHTGFVNGGAFLADDRVVTTCFDATIRVWDGGNGAQLARWPTQKTPPLCLSVAPGGNNVAAGFRDGAVRLFDVDKGVEVLRLEGHTERVLGVAFLSDGRRLASASQDRTLRLWDLAKGQEIARISDDKHLFNALAVTPDGQTAFTAGGMWKTEKNEWIQEFDYAVRMWQMPKSRGRAPSYPR